MTPQDRQTDTDRQTDSHTDSHVPYSQHHMSFYNFISTSLRLAVIFFTD